MDGQGVDALVWVLLALLLVPALAGALLGYAAGSWAAGLVLGSIAGVLLSSIIVTRTVLSRFELLAPGGEEEDSIE